MPIPVQPHIREIRPFETAKPLASVASAHCSRPTIFLDANENPYGPSPLVSSTLVNSIEGIHRYPSGSSQLLRERIAEYVGVSSSQIMVGNGSDECIRLIIDAIVGCSQDEIIVCEPTFVSYSLATINRNGTVIRVGNSANGQADVNSIAKAVTKNTRAVFLANPNNPTGTITPIAELKSFLERICNDCLVVLDEAYFEYAVHDPNYIDSVSLLKSYSNVVILRTFSKAFGLAGLRCGYAVGSSEFLAELNKIRMPFNVNSMAQAACIATLEDVDYMRQHSAETVVLRKRLSAVLARCGIPTYESSASFVFADLGRDASPLVQQLADSGILIRNCSVFGCPSAIRVSIGTPQEMAVLEAELPAHIKEVVLK